MSKPKSAKRKETEKENLPATPGGGGKDDASICVICMSDLAAQGITGTLDCQHQFCFECIEAWSNQSNTCPLCKARFKFITRRDRSADGAKGRGKAKGVKKVRVKDAEPPPVEFGPEDYWEEFYGDAADGVALDHAREEMEQNLLLGINFVGFGLSHYDEDEDEDFVDEEEIDAELASSSMSMSSSSSSSSSGDDDEEDNDNEEDDDDEVVVLEPRWGSDADVDLVEDEEDPFSPGSGASSNLATPSSADPLASVWGPRARGDDSYREESSSSATPVRRQPSSRTTRRSVVAVTPPAAAVAYPLRSRRGRGTATATANSGASTNNEGRGRGGQFAVPAPRPRRAAAAAAAPAPSRPRRTTTATSSRTTARSSRSAEIVLSSSSDGSWYSDEED